MFEATSHPIVMLHGFAATRRAWDAVIERLPPERYRPLALDLPGHGANAKLRPITFSACVEHVLDGAPSLFSLAGYSLGGRVALQVALAAPERLSRLVLISTTAGIGDEAARAARRTEEERLAQELEHGDHERFIARWRGQPLFAADPPEVARAAAADQRRNSPADLAAVLRGVGAGQMAPLWERLGELPMPVTVIVGRRDQRYRELGLRLVTALPDARLRVIAGGHALLLENPGAVARELQGA